jgi:sigma-B regulation protein RsbU (phosphoserine phosphatase)
MALGVDEAASYRREKRSGIANGDVLLIGTDVIWETRNASAETFGKQRLGRILSDHHRMRAQDIVQAILDGLEQFRGKEPLEDDITLLIIKADAGTR